MAQKQGELTRQRKLAIIDFLIQNQETDTTEVRQSSQDLSSKKNQSAALTKPLEELWQEHIIPEKPKGVEHVKGVRGGTPFHIQIIKNCETIRVIFESYPMFHTALYNSDWIREMMVNERITFPMSNKSKEELKRYLRASPSFFKYFLTREKIDEIAHEWFWHIYPGIVEYSHVIKLYRNGKTSLPPKSFHEFFYVCAFIDELNGDQTHEAKKIIEKYERIIKN